MKSPKPFSSSPNGWWRRLLAAALTLSLAAVWPSARADSVIYLNNFNNASNNIANNSDGIGGGFTVFTWNQFSGFYFIDAFETNTWNGLSGGFAVLASSDSGIVSASLDSVDAFPINGGGTTFELGGVNFSTNTPFGNWGAGIRDRFMFGVSTIASAGDWLSNGPPAAIPTGFWIQFMSDSLATGTGNGGWSGTSTLFYKGASTNAPTALCSWAFDHLKWSTNGTNVFSPTLDIKLTLSGTGWALNITGDTATNLPISYNGTYAGSGITNQLINGLASAHFGGLSQQENPGIAMQIDQAKVTQLGNLVVTTPAFSTPEYGFNTNTVLAGEAIALTSIVTDSAATPTLQWQITDLSNPGAFTNLPGGIGTNVNVDTSGLGDSQPRGIRLVASDTMGNVVTSAVVNLTANPGSVPVIAQDIFPAANNVYYGQGVRLTASFAGNKPILLQWQISPDGSAWSSLSGATNNSYLITIFGPGDEGYYRLAATNSLGSGYSSQGYVFATNGGAPQYIWSAPIPFGGLNADQVLTNFPPNCRIAGAMCATNGGMPIVVTTGQGNILFGPSSLGSDSVTGANGFGIGVSTNRTGNPSFDTCLNSFAYDNTNHTITLSGLTAGRQYQVQLFGLDDRSGNLNRLQNWQDPANAADASSAYKMGDNAYMLGTFIASNTVQTIQQNLLTTGGAGNFNCLVLRTVGWNPPPYFALQPQNQGRFTRTNMSFVGIAGGDSTLGPIVYQWMAGPSGGPYSNLVEGAKYHHTQTSSLTISNLASSDGIPVYVLAASNIGGTQNSREAVLIVQTAPPPPATGSYAAYALSYNPVALWMLDETNDPASGVVMGYDYTGNGHNAVYGTATQNGFNGVQGPQPPAYPGFDTNEAALKTTANNSSSIATVPPLNDTNLATTVAMWIKPIDNGSWAQGLMGGRNNNLAGQIWQFGYAGGYSGGNGTLGYNWNDNAGTYNYNSGLAPVIGTWNFVALVITSNNATFYLYYLNASGQAILQKAVNSVANNTVISMNYGPTVIGSDPYSLAARAFNGSIAGVALYNRALTEGQVRQLFAAGVGMSTNFPPVLSGSVVSGVNGHQLVLTWPFGTLLRATNVLGPWTTNAAQLSPFTNDMIKPADFFKVSNP